MRRLCVHRWTRRRSSIRPASGCWTASHAAACSRSMCRAFTASAHTTAKPISAHHAGRAEPLCVPWRRSRGQGRGSRGRRMLFCGGLLLNGRHGCPICICTIAAIRCRSARGCNNFLAPLRRSRVFVASAENGSLRIDVSPTFCLRSGPLPFPTLLGDHGGQFVLSINERGWRIAAHASPRRGPWHICDGCNPGPPVRCPAGG